MFDVFYSGQRPGLFPHEQRVESLEQAQQLSRTRYFWWINYLTDYQHWDFLWEPVPWQSHQRHAWPSQWQKDSETYLIPKSWTGQETNYHTDKKLTRKPCLDHWSNLEHCEFDTSWHPDPTEPPFLHEFATQWWPQGGPVYSAPSADSYKYHQHPKARLMPRHDNHWHTLEDCEFDYSWRPHPKDPPYIYVFGNQWWSPEVMPTVRYTVPGATQEKFVYYPKAQLLPGDPNKFHKLVPCDFDLSWVPDPGDPPYIYVFGNQWHSAEKMPTVEMHMPGATQRKYLARPRATLLPDPTHWTVPDDIVGADLSWVPDPGSPPYIYQFATQHQKTGGPRYTVPGATEVKYLAELHVHTVSKATAIVEIDHLDGNAGHIPNVKRRVRYFDNYRDTLVRIAKSMLGEHEYIWVCSSICDYTDFDFSWHPEDWQATMLHVFASNDQKFGDTFFVHVPTFAEYAEKKQLLEWYNVNYVDRPVPRRSMPVIEHTNDTHVDTVKNTDWSGPLALFTNNGVPITLPTVSLWRAETKTVVPLSQGASAVVVPKSARASVSTQMYDYPFIDKTNKNLHGDSALDIVFISNGERSAEQNYSYLLDSTYNRNNRVYRVDGVNGRVAAYHAAARASTTAWFFAVFAKLHVNINFDWTWQPDRMQAPKHYIFHAKNPVNGLEYGHQAMIAYNRTLVLNNPGVGLDFTLDSAHEVVPVMSGIAVYNTSPWSAWRTAFREVIKLRHSLPDVESEYRMNQWLRGCQGEYGFWSQAGAEDAVEYYNEVGGNFAELRQSYDWSWLASYAFMKRGLTPDRSHILLQDQ